MRSTDAIRRDWLRTRAEFEREEARAASARAARARDARAQRALEDAEKRFPAIPVASPYARRLREDYLANAARTASSVSVSAFARSRAAFWPSIVSLVVFVVVAALIARSVTLSSTDPAVVTIPVILIIATVWFFVWLFLVVTPALSAVRWYTDKRIGAFIRDADAYSRWLDSIDAARRDADARLCVCPHTNGVHDVDCPALYV